MYETIYSAVQSVDNLVWGWAMILLLLGTHIFMTIRTKGIQRKVFKGIKLSVTKDPEAEGEVSQFGALTTALAATIGTGNIIGVGTAIALGGPGAVLWCWLTGVFGIATKYSEALISVKYRVKTRDGRMLGGAMYALERGLHAKWLGLLFAIFGGLASFGIGCATQVNAIASVCNENLGIPTWIIGIIVGILVAMVIFGGINRIAKVSEWMVPVMAGIYLLIAFYVVIKNINLMPQVIYDIVTSAFSLNAAFGGGMGLAMMTGIKRGLFSNEAGMGSVPNAAATATTDHPVTQGLIQALGVFVDTLLVCTASAFIVMLSKDYMGVGLSGIELVQYALVEHIGAWSSIFLAIMIFLFAFSSIIGNYYYGEINIAFMWQSKKALNIFRIFVVLMVMFGSVAKVSLVWNLADLFMALMAITNLIAISRLAPNAYLALKDYLAQKKAGIKDPVFKASVLKDKTGVEVWKD